MSIWTKVYGIMEIETSYKNKNKLLKCLNNLPEIKGSEGKVDYYLNHINYRQNHYNYVIIIIGSLRNCCISSIKNKIIENIKDIFKQDFIYRGGVLNLNDDMVSENIDLFHYYIESGELNYDNGEYRE